MRLRHSHFTRERLLLYTIMFFAGALRLYNTNWDQGFSLHPDERAIVMSVLKLQMPSSLQELLTPVSPLNPHFFAYGSLPFYILMGTSWLFGHLNPNLTEYGGINIVGRIISAVADSLTVIVLFLIGAKLMNKRVGFSSAFFYAIAVLPIQASHFYAVDILLTFFISLTLLRLLYLYEKPTLKNAALVGICLGASLATKVSAIPLVIAISITLIIDFAMIVAKQPHLPNIWFPKIPKVLKKVITDGFVIIITALFIFMMSMPYAIIDFKSFWEQSLLQSKMTHDAFTFPYTLQYVGKIPYIYELKNIYLWGLGPLIASLSFVGALYFLIHTAQKIRKDEGKKEIIIFSFFIIYFAVVANFAVGWIRYMLPLYPILCLFAAVFAVQIIFPYLKSLKSKYIFTICYLLFTIVLLIWPFAFVNIYSKPNTRVQASKWIHENIAQGTNIAVEHWDDRLPLQNSNNYNITDLPLYDPDTKQKWLAINHTLENTDYIIIASNRLYTPLQKLTDCQNLPINKCYPKTTKYYERLFNGNLGFLKVAEFTSYPGFKIPALSKSNGGAYRLEIHDDSADESFTVYDHPKVMIFKNMTR